MMHLHRQTFSTFKMLIQISRNCQGCCDWQSVITQCAENIHAKSVKNTQHMSNTLGSLSVCYPPWRTRQKEQ